MLVAKRPQRKQDFLLEVLDGEMLIYDPTRTRALCLNDTASLIWQLCDGERTVEEIAKVLRDTYPEAGEAVEDDVDTMVRRFAEHGAIELH